MSNFTAIPDLYQSGENLQAVVSAMKHIYPELYTVFKETPRLLRELEEYYRAEMVPVLEKEINFEGRGEKGIRIEPPPAILPYLHRSGVRRVLTLHSPEMPDVNFSNLPPDELRLYFTLTRRAEIPQMAPIELPSASIEPQLVWVPAGPFLMGTSEEEAKQAIADGMKQDWVKAEQPQHSVELSEYWIGKYPLTNLEYQAFVKEADHRPPLHWNGNQYPEGKGDHPVVNVSWEDAMAYCTWLSERTGKTYRLPTEAEWEKAACGTDGRTYPWGDEFDSDKCNTNEAGISDTTPVGKYSPAGDSPYSCADMAGNIWEWCADWFDPGEYHRRAESVLKDPSGPSYGTFHVLRGGSFTYVRRYARCASRLGSDPDLRLAHFGFRVVFFPLDGT